MRLPLWLKLSFVISIVFTGALWAVLNSTNRVFSEDKRAFLIEMSSKINSSVVRLFEERITSLQKKLAIFTSNFQSLSPQQKSHPDLENIIFNQYPEFVLISLAEKGGAIEWMHIHPESELRNWAQSFLASQVGGLANQKIQDGSVFFQSVSGPNNEAYFSMIMPVRLEDSSKSYNIVSILPTSIFSDLLADYKASLNNVFVVDSGGSLVAHPFSHGLAQSYMNHPLVNQSLRDGRSQGSGDNFYDLDNNEIVASFQTIPLSNLRVFTTTLKKEAFAAADELLRTLIVIAIGVLIISILIAFLFTKLITSPLDRLKTIAAKIGKGDFKVLIDVNSRDEVGDLATSIGQMTKDLVQRDEALENSKKALVQSEKMSAFGQLSAGIAHEVKNPLAGILGHAQLAKSKTKDKELLKHIDFVEKETRRTKEIIENLMKFTRAEKLELSPTNLYDTVHGAVDLVDHQLSLQNVKIFKHIQRVSPVLGHSNQIQQVLLNLMMNAGHAMEDAEKKELHVFLEDVGDNVQIRIQDSGCGMPKEVQERIFEPFFTTKPAGKGTGLGLSVSIGIVNDHNGKIYIESEPNKGTTFFIDIPANNEVELPESNRAIGEVEIDKKVDEIENIEDEVFSEENILFGESEEGLTKKLNIESGESNILRPPSPDEKHADDNQEVKIVPRVVMPSSRDYLMTKEDLEKSSRSKMKIKKESKVDLDTKTSEFAVKIRKPKIGK